MNDKKENSTEISVCKSGFRILSLFVVISQSLLLFTQNERKAKNIRFFYSSIINIQAMFAYTGGKSRQIILRLLNEIK